MFPYGKALQDIEADIRQAEKLLHSGFPEVSTGLSSQQLRLDILKRCQEEIALNNRLTSILLEEQKYIPEIHTQTSNYAGCAEKLSAQQLQHISTRVHISNLRLKYLYTKSLEAITEFERRQLTSTRKRSSESLEDCRPSPKQPCLMRHNVNLELSPGVY